MKFYNKVIHDETESLNLKSHKNVFFNIYFILGENTIIVSFFFWKNGPLAVQNLQKVNLLFEINE